MRTHIHFLLDRSGSMGSMADEVVTGVNAFVAAQRADGSDARMTLVQFDSQDPFEVLVDARRIDRVPELTLATFQPRASTPLLDATGDLIAHADRRIADRRARGKKPEDILVVTFTDGHENSSHRFTLPRIVELVKAREADGWTFVYLGAGLDAYGESRGLGLHDGAAQAFAPDPQGARMAFESLAMSTVAYRARRRAGAPKAAGEFFADAKPAEDDRKGRWER